MRRRPHDGADVLGRDAATLRVDVRKSAPRLPPRSSVGEQLGIDPVGDRNHARTDVAFGVQNLQLAPLTIDVADIERCTAPASAGHTRTGAESSDDPGVGWGFPWGTLR